MMLSILNRGIVSVMSALANCLFSEYVNAEFFKVTANRSFAVRQNPIHRNNFALCLRTVDPHSPVKSRIISTVIARIV